MTITTANNKVSAIGDGVQTNFPYDFKVTDTSQMLVYLDDVLYTESYIVNGVGDDAGGSVDISVPPGTGAVVLLYRLVADTQETDYEPYRAFPSQTTEDDFDLSVMRDQQIQEQLDRSIKAPISDDGSFDYTLPATHTPGRAFKVNLTGDGYIETTYDPDEAQTDSAASAAAALVSETAAALAEASAAAAWDSFKILYLGAKTSDPALDNEGNPLVDGALYWNTTTNLMKVYDLGGEVWILTTDNADQLDGQHGDYYLARGNHTGTQAIATITGHTLALHTGLGLAPVASPTFTGDPTAPTKAAGDNSTKLATTAYADTAGAAGAASVGQSELKTATGTVSLAVSGGGTNVAWLTLPGGEHGFYPRSWVSVATFYGSLFANTEVARFTNTAALTQIGLYGDSIDINGTVYASQRYVQSSPPYKIGDINWGHFLYQMRNKTTKEVICSYEAQDPPWAYNGPDWLDKNDPELLALIPHPFPDFGTALFPETDFEVILVDLRDFDVNLWQYDNRGLGKTVLTNLKDFAPLGNTRTHQEVGIPEIAGFTNKIKIVSRV